MSQRRAKQARQLTHHVEYGAYYPAMARSQKKLDALDLTKREERRAHEMSERKLQKRFQSDLCHQCGSRLRIDVQEDRYVEYCMAKCGRPDDVEMKEPR